MSSLNAKDVDLQANTEKLKQDLNLVGRYRVGITKSKAAEDTIKTIEVAKLETQKNMAITALTMLEASARAALVAQAMPQFGALEIELGSAIDTVDRGLSNSFAAASYAHMQNYEKNLQVFKENASAEELGMIQQVLENNKISDISRSHQRMLQAKEMVNDLYGFGIEGIGKAKNKLY